MFFNFLYDQRALNSDLTSKIVDQYSIVYAGFICK